MVSCGLPYQCISVLGILYPSYSILWVNHFTKMIQLQKIQNSILESQGNVDESKLQAKFVHPFGEENKSTKTDFVEYWVPVRLSNIQTEQYCGSLFSNSTVLCSSYKCDPVKGLHEILVSTKKVSICFGI